MLDDKLSATNRNPRVRRAQKNAKQVEDWKREKKTTLQGVVSLRAVCPSCGADVVRSFHPSRALEGVGFTCECGYWLEVTMAIVWGRTGNEPQATKGEFGK